MTSFLKPLIDRAFVHPAAYRLRQLLISKDGAGAYGRLLPELARRSILELGCGPGTNVPSLSAAGSYLGVDVNPRYVETARRLHPANDFQAVDALEFRPERRFDLILIDSFLHHLADDRVTELLARAAGWLAEEGVIVVHEPLVPERRELFHRLLMRLDRGDFFRQLDHWRGLAAAAGLAVGELVQYELRIVGVASHHMVGMRLKSPSPGVSR